MIPLVALNWWAILVAAVINMILGYLWYGPVFGAPWRKEMGVSNVDNSMKSGAMPMWPMLGAFVAAFVVAFFLRHAVAYAGAMDWASGAIVGFCVWLGFVATIMLNSIFFEKKSWTLYAINAGYYFVSLIIMGALLAAWV